MRSSVVFCMAVSFAMFGFGLSLQCYSCPGGSASSCEVKQECEQAEDTCLELKSGDTTYTGCMRYTDCNIRMLTHRFMVSEFTFKCCQSQLCNGKSFMDKLKDFFRG